MFALYETQTRNTTTEFSQKQKQLDVRYHYYTYSRYNKSKLDHSIDKYALRQVNHCLSCKSLHQRAFTAFIFRGNELIKPKYVLIHVKQST